MTGNLSLLCNFVEKYLGTVRFGNDQFAPILGYGDLVQGNITIKRVYYVEGLNHNLFSVGQFCDEPMRSEKSTSSISQLSYAKASPSQDGYGIEDFSHPQLRLHQLAFEWKAKMKKKGMVHFGGIVLSQKGYRATTTKNKVSLVESNSISDLDEIKRCSETSVDKTLHGSCPQTNKASDFDNPDPAPELQMFFLQQITNSSITTGVGSSFLGPLLR
ncbi:hypothetical protein Tco_1112195 [Tanacetum coccineum]|uniref:Retrovirus-related Pol polyprotein from transposon TNT 1-94-like beta-barrel domain-containing protein n=1 Tax=Tanacetum coccineum TaxID=301880 RepID=A0ABQ5INR3_9ASTR